MLKFYGLIYLLVHILEVYCEKRMFEGFIMGDLASAALFPHAVFVKCDCKNKRWGCSASILNQQILLTAGHCFLGCDNSHGQKIEVYAGNEHLGKVTQVHRLGKFVIHEDYNPQTGYCDIALGMLKHSLRFDHNVKRVWIAPSFLNSDGLAAGHVVSWGIGKTTQLNSVDLNEKRMKFVYQRIREPKVCENARGSKTPVVPGTMCATSNSLHEYPEQEDIGSGLVMQTYQQIGVMSSQGRTHKYVTIYTNVSYFFNWINSQSVRLFCAKPPKKETKLKFLFF